MSKISFLVLLEFVFFKNESLSIIPLIRFRLTRSVRDNYFYFSLVAASDEVSLSICFKQLSISLSSITILCNRFYF